MQRWTIVVAVVLLGYFLVSCDAAARATSAQPSQGTCLLPSFDAGYLQNPGATPQVLCVNTGKPATPQQIAAQEWAPQCMDGGAVSCYHPCYAYTAGGNYPYHVVPCPSDAATATARASNR